MVPVTKAQFDGEKLIGGVLESQWSNDDSESPEGLAPASRVFAKRSVSRLERSCVPLIIPHACSRHLARLNPASPFVSALLPENVDLVDTGAAAWLTLYSGAPGA